MELPRKLTWYLDGLNEVERERVLTKPMSDMVSREGEIDRCLIFVALGVDGLGEIYTDEENPLSPYHDDQRRGGVDGAAVGCAYDTLCIKYGVEATNAAIREYLVTHPIRKYVRPKEQPAVQPVEEVVGN